MNSTPICCNQEAHWVVISQNLQYWYYKQCKNEVVDRKPTVETVGSGSFNTDFDKAVFTHDWNLNSDNCKCCGVSGEDFLNNPHYCPNALKTQCIECGYVGNQRDSLLFMRSDGLHSFLQNYNNNNIKKIVAIKYRNIRPELDEFCPILEWKIENGVEVPYIPLPRRKLKIFIGDWIIKLKTSEFYPCSDYILKHCYKPTEQAP